MRLSDALRRCAAAVRTAVTRVGRTIVRAAHTVGRAARWALPALAAACGRAPSRSEPASKVAAVERVTNERESPRPAATEAVSRPDPSVAPVDAAVDPGPRSLGKFQMTMYYVIGEEEVDGPARGPVSIDDAKPANDNHEGAERQDRPDVNLAAGSGTGSARADVADDELLDLVPIVDQACEPITYVSHAFRKQIMLQGTGRLRDGRLVNVAGHCKCPAQCFHIVAARHKWGTGGSGLSLEPFRVVAVDPRVIKMGSFLYIPELDGRRMPGPPGVGGYIHDGCVIAGDTGGGIQGTQLDLFVGRKAYFNGLATRGGSHKWAHSVEVFDGNDRCQRRGGKVTRSAAGSI